MNILVTGSTGFVGTALIERLIKDQFFVSATVRNGLTNKCNSDVNLIDIGHLTSSLDWGHALRGVNTIVHLAARAHILNDKSKDPLADYRYINVNCSLNLARQAARSKTLSTIGSGCFSSIPNSSFASMPNISEAPI